MKGDLFLSKIEELRELCLMKTLKTSGSSHTPKEGWSSVKRPPKKSPVVDAQEIKSRQDYERTTSLVSHSHESECADWGWNSWLAFIIQEWIRRLGRQDLTPRGMSYVTKLTKRSHRESWVPLSKWPNNISYDVSHDHCSTSLRTLSVYPSSHLEDTGHVRVVGGPRGCTSRETFEGFGSGKPKNPFEAIQPYWRI